jgi:spore maturation protein CgeB
MSRSRLRIAFFGSSLVSSYWNGAATYYRGLLRALAARGHTITFYEPDAYDRQKHRDIPDPSWARVVVYSGQDERAAMSQVSAAAQSADVLVKASGIGVYDQLLEQAVPASVTRSQLAIFWDVDAPATLERVNANPKDPFRSRIDAFDAIFTYGGGDPVVSAYRDLGARLCVPIYNALDPETHHPVPAIGRYAADLSLLANRLPDREARIEQFFFEPARRLPERKFLLGGSGWTQQSSRPNVAVLGHVSTAQHNAFNCSALAVLNVARDSMAAVGFSPATRVFEAAGAGSCIITDAWRGIEQFLEPDVEVLVAEGADQVVEHVQALTRDRARKIGEAGRRRVLAQHTYGMRALQVEDLLLRGESTSWDHGSSRKVPAESASSEPASAELATSEVGA